MKYNDVYMSSLQKPRELEEKIEELELEDSIDSVKQGEKEYKEGKTIKAKTLETFLTE